jgi:hypothetical protein
VKSTIGVKAPVQIDWSVNCTGRCTRDNRTSVQDALPIVIVAVVIVAAVVAVATLLSSRGAYDRIGRGELTFDHDAAAPPPASDPYREEEIRQLLEARNARRIAHGDEPIDVDAELAALTRPAPDDALRAEVRALVEARNARRIARGRSPLNVEAEVERRLSELDG